MPYEYVGRTIISGTGAWHQYVVAVLISWYDWLELYVLASLITKPRCSQQATSIVYVPLANTNLYGNISNVLY